MTYLLSFLGLTLFVGGASVAVGEITDNTSVTLALLIPGLGGVCWLVWNAANWRRDVVELKREVDEMRAALGLPAKHHGKGGRK